MSFSVKDLMELKEACSLFGGSKPPVHGITPIFWMVELIRITGIAQNAETN
jgi:hypothetical protein